MSHQIWAALSDENRTPEPEQTIASVLGGILYADWSALSGASDGMAGAVGSLTQSTANRRPAFDGTQYTGDGSDDRLVATLSPAIPAGLRPYVFAVGRMTDTSEPCYAFGLWSNATDNPANQTLAVSRANGLWAGDRRDSSGYQNSAAGAADTELHVFEVGYTAGGVASLVVDGAGRDSTKSGAPTTDMGSLITHAILFGSDSYSSKFALRRLIICSAEPTAEQKRTVRALLKEEHEIPTAPLERVELFDMATLNPQFGVPQSFGGAVSDGSRYVYFLPALSHNYMVRVDAHMPFGSPGSIETFNLSNIGADVGRQWGCFDGRYVYVAPYYGSDLVRYDTHAPFSMASSFAKFDLQTVDALGYGFTGMVFDGQHHVYLVPSNNALPSIGMAIRFDTDLAFGSAASYEKFDCTTLHADCRGFSLGGCDGNYVYFAPWDASDVPSDNRIVGRVTRFKIGEDFTNAASWQHFDLTTLNPSAKGLSHGGFDGRYVYFTQVELSRGALDGGLFVRFDSTKELDDPTAHAFFDAELLWPKAVGYYEAVWDGSRYVYMIDFRNGLNLRCDTTQVFTSSAAWLPIDGGAFFDGATVVGFGGGIAHNGDIYIPPSAGRHAVKIGASV